MQPGAAILPFGCGGLRVARNTGCRGSHELLVGILLTAISNKALKHAEPAYLSDPEGLLSAGKPLRRQCRTTLGPDKRVRICPAAILKRV